jgi:hypothetical protein
MATQIFRDGVEYALTTVVIPVQLRDKAKKARISFTKTLIDGLENKLAEEMKA